MNCIGEHLQGDSSRLELPRRVRAAVVTGALKHGSRIRLYSLATRHPVLTSRNWSYLLGTIAPRHWGKHHRYGYLVRGSSVSGCLRFRELSALDLWYKT